MSMPYDVKALHHPKDDELEEWILSVWPDIPGDKAPSPYFKAKDDEDWERYVALVKRRVLHYLEKRKDEGKPFYFPRLNFVPIY